jgi:hypothetical protein
MKNEIKVGIEIKVSLETVQKLVAEYIHEKLGKPVNPKEILCDYDGDYDDRYFNGMSLNF